MGYKTIVYSFGNILILLAGTMLFPFFWAVKDGSGDIQPFVVSILITAFVGALMRRFKPEGKFGRREGFVIVGLGWIVLVAFGALPLYFSGAVPTYTDAYFEIMSGFTTTGSTVIGDVEALPRGILFWRSFTIWLGGMGIIMLSLAVFPVLGGGFSMYQAEVPSLIPEKLVPRMKHTAFVLWAIYSGISLIEVIALKLAGMNFYESLLHTFASMGTGGFSSRNISIEAYQSVSIELIITFFMMVAGLNFSLYYRAIQKKSLWAIFKDAEAKGYVLILSVAALLIVISLVFSMHLSPPEALRQAVFQVVSICTTTGFSSTDFALWPSFAQFVLFLLMFVGGCAGSTGGAIKVARILLLFKYMWKQVLKVARPRLTIQSKLGDVPIDDSVVHETLAFFFTYIFLFVTGVLIISFTGLDLVSAVSTSATALGNVGPGLGKVGPLSNFGFLHPVAKWVMSFLMLIGRLEIMTVLVMFSPSFWKK